MVIRRWLVTILLMVGWTSVWSMTPESYIRQVSDVTDEHSVVIVDAIRRLHGVIDPRMVLAIIEKESRYRKKAVSPTGSRGLMQIQTRWHRDKIKKRDIHDVYVNVEVGVQVLKDCLEKTGRIEKALTCYNGGGDRHYSKKVFSTYRKIIAANVAF